MPPFLTALMIANGANAGNLSPFSSVGIIANGAMAKAGLTGDEGRVWFANFAAHVLVAARPMRGWSAGGVSAGEAAGYRVLLGRAVRAARGSDVHRELRCRSRRISG